MTNESQPETATIRLDHFLQLAGIVGSGGQAKQLIQSGDVLVNGEPETRRRRKLAERDVVYFAGNRFLVSEFTSKD